MPEPYEPELPQAHRSAGYDRGKSKKFFRELKNLKTPNYRNHYDSTQSRNSLKTQSFFPHFQCHHFINFHFKGKSKIFFDGQKIKS